MIQVLLPALTLAVLIPLVGSLLWYVLGKERVERHDTQSFDDPRR